ncbi:MAG: PilN domain-containing protein [Deltaproteobacteria bacterium]|nr:PilN domain-containing protein [Deltaproteobacteria bacterium]
MIRINLLPVRAAKKKESVRFQLTVAGLAVFFILALMSVFYLTVRSEANGLKADMDRGQKELDSLKAKIGELSRIKEQKKVVEEKLDIIKRLEAQRTGPVDMFRKLSDAIPKKAWVLSVSDKGPVTTLVGYAADDEVVAEFMRGLQRQDIGTVELEVAQRAIEKETGVDAVNFIIRLEKEMPKPEGKK